MTTFKVTAYNEYSTKPENCRMVIKMDVEAETVTGALDQMQEWTNGWNSQMTIENQIVHMITCNGFIRNV